MKRDTGRLTDSGLLAGQRRNPCTGRGEKIGPALDQSPALLEHIARGQAVWASCLSRCANAA